MTVSTYLINPRVKGKLREKQVSIYLEVNAFGSSFKVPTSQVDEKISPVHWNFERQQAKPGIKDGVLINHRLTKLIDEITTIYREKRPKSIEEFKALVVGRHAVTDEKKTLKHAFIEVFLPTVQAEYDEKYYFKFRALSHHLWGGESRKKKILGYSEKHGAIDFDSLTLTFYDQFKRFLWKKGLINSSVHKYIKNLKTFLSWAAARDYQVNKSYEQWHAPDGDLNPIPLTYEELMQFKDAPLTGNLAIGRDYFCVEAFTCQRISDVVGKLKPGNITSYGWEFTQTKGRRASLHKITIPFVGYCENALPIIQKYEGTMPDYAEGTINLLIKDAAKAAGLTRKIIWEEWQGSKCTTTEYELHEIISTHFGRTTFITLGLQFMPAKIVKDLAGIKSWATLRKYEGNSEIKVVKSHLIDMEAKLRAS